MRYFLSISLIVCLLATSAFAQKQGWWSKSPNTAAAKVAGHQDTPLICWEFAWNDTSSHWDSLAITTFTYNPDGTVAYSERQDDNGTTLVLYQRNAYAYYPDGKLKDKWYLYRNGNAWDSAAHDSYVYDQFGNTTIYYSDVYNGTSWDHAAGERLVYTYRNVDQIETQVGSQWSFQQQAWILVDSIVYAFDGNNERTSDTHYGYSGTNWDPSFRWLGYSWQSFADLAPSAATKEIYSGGWLPQERFTATYGPYLSPTAIFEQSISPGVWDTAYQVIQQFDSMEHLILAENYFYQADTFALIGGEQNLYTYDGAGHTLERITLNSQGIAYYNIQRYLYDAFFVGAAEPITPSLQVVAYPNPAADHFSIQFADNYRGPVQMQLFDLQGRLRTECLVSRANGTCTMPIAEVLENGTYLYRVTTKAGVASGKVVVQR
jgi:Secretion system C-terminal sorting domain